MVPVEDVTIRFDGGVQLTPVSFLTVPKYLLYAFDRGLHLQLFSIKIYMAEILEGCTKSCITDPINRRSGGHSPYIVIYIEYFYICSCY